MEAAARAVHDAVRAGGRRWAPELWLVVAQAGGLLAFAFTYRLAARLAGWPRGRDRGRAACVLADEFIRNFARGNSEGLLVALCLWAIERHLDGRRRDAFVLGVAGRAAAAGAVAVPARSTASG